MRAIEWTLKMNWKHIESPYSFYHNKGKQIHFGLFEAHRHNIKAVIEMQSFYRNMIRGNAFNTIVNAR